MTLLSNTAKANYEKWLHSASIDADTRKELDGLEGQTAEIEERFYRDLEFGTGGLRGIIGAGTNRINRYTVGRATQGLAQYLIDSKTPDPLVVIAYDSRNFSPEFALESALVLAGNGIKACVFESLRPTPELSFAVRELNASAGIVVTASHNPPEYNGYKVYGADGCQMVPHAAEQVLERIAALQSFDAVKVLEKEAAEKQGLLRFIGKEIDDKYTDTVVSYSVHPEEIRKLGADFKIVYTPLHGSGNVPVREVLRKAGFAHVHVVPEQEKPDGFFSTVKSPNPEEKEAFTLAISQATEIGADIIVGTDPDADRMGAVVKDSKGEYFVLSGNQSGAIMVHYLMSSLKEKGRLPLHPAVVKTIVTSEMGAVIAQKYGATVFNTLTGFKYIGEKINEFEQSKQYEFVFGYEESYGYLAGNYARDKDAVIASLLICEAAAYYKSQGKTLYDVLQELYQEHGYFLERLVSRTLKGKDGVAQIQGIMNKWRSEPPREVNGAAVAELLDYSLGIDDLPIENVLKFKLADGSWFCLRPSGTEPKIKLYFAVKGSSLQDAESKISGLVDTVMARVDQ